MLFEILYNLNTNLILEKSNISSLKFPFFNNNFTTSTSFNFTNNNLNLNLFDDELVSFSNVFFFDLLLNIENINFFNVKINYYFGLYSFLLNILLYDTGVVSWIVLDSYYDNFFNNYYSYDLVHNNNYFKNLNYSDINYNFFLLNIISFSLIFLILDVFNSVKITKISDLFFFKITNYINNFSKNYRINFQVLFLSFFFIFESFIFSIMQSNNSNIEYIELIHSSIVYFIFFIIIFLLYKYSIHYFSFLEQSVIEGENSSFIAKQFVRDLSNTFALFLRFFLLLFRLNIYDGLDDFLDSYCIFFAEFSEMSEFNYDCDIYISNANYSFNILNDSGDVSIDDIDFLYFLDFIILYYETAIESVNYWLFLLEEIFRLILAIYIIYLIILEVHTINLNYIEDNYIYIKK